ncbi:hypothetical protein [Halomonas sp. 3H]|uniref:hypothetical protein n=1 Tax=Halomonas sp. 3H TaxID=2952527 RepID=UPI0020B8ABB2|nr:hypothetical protein [Halomonas sp. 3H]
MKTTITFDTARLSDPEQRQRIEEAPGFELAALLRELAEECDRTSDLPEPRALLLCEEENGHRPTVGAVATRRAPLPSASSEEGEGPSQDTLAVSYALTVGDEALLRRASLSTCALASLLARDDLLQSERDGLVMLLAMVSVAMEERAEFIHETRGGGHHDL